MGHMRDEPARGEIVARRRPVGQKIHPIGLRLGIVKDWESKWYAEKNFPDLIQEDQTLRRHIKRKLGRAGISRVEIERTDNRVRITIHSARPGIIIGRGGTGIDALKKELEAMTAKQIQLNVQEIRRAELEAVLVAQNVAGQLERRRPGEMRGRPGETVVLPSRMPRVVVQRRPEPHADAQEGEVS